MTNQEILAKAIQKAIDGGWKPGPQFQFTGWNEAITFDYGLQCSDKWHKFKVTQLVFDHDFAKAIAGDDWTKFLCDLVVEEDPVKELAKWI